MTRAASKSSHDGYVRSFGLVHKRSLMLGNDGKELRGADQLMPKGRKKIREAAPYAVRFHLAPGVEATIDRRRHGRDPALEGRAAVELPLPRRQSRASRKACGSTATASRSARRQLVIVGEVSALGGEIGWTFRRAS